MEGFNYEIDQSAAASISSAAQVHLIIPVVPIEVIRWGVILSVATTVAAATLTADHEVIGGGALTPSGAADMGTVTVPVAAIGKGYYNELAEPYLVVPGEQMQINSDGGSTAGSGVVWCQYRRLSFVDGTIDRGAAEARTAPTADATWLQQYTKVTS